MESGMCLDRINVRLIPTIQHKYDRILSFFVIVCMQAGPYRGGRVGFMFSWYLLPCFSFGEAHLLPGSMHSLV